MVMFDSLSRDFLSPYGCDWTITPNFKRLQEHSVTFDQCYVGSMPCMPARRELHTGRFNFLHRGWGPLEPFDDSMPELLKNQGVTSHLISDHQHYWEDGGGTYHPRYSSWEISRGQEGDPWKCIVDFHEKTNSAFHVPNVGVTNQLRRQDQINRTYMDTLEKTSQGHTFEKGIEFLDCNHSADNWFLQIETFDPHEPFYSLEQFKQLYPHAYDGDEADWPPYYFVKEDENVVAHTRKEYAALLSMCDYFLGKVLDKMDEYDLWKDTMLIVNTDHGYLLGEHGWWAKTAMPLYQEIAHIPLFIWDPRSKIQNQRRNALVQTVDLAPTILEFFNLPIPKDMEGKALKDTIFDDYSIRDYAYFGYFGAHINVCDGKQVYMRAPISRYAHSIHEYTLMPTHMRERFQPSELQDIMLQEPFSFTKGCKTMKILAKKGLTNAYNFGDKLFDIKYDKKQEVEIVEPKSEIKFLQAIYEFMKQNDAPEELYTYYGLPIDHALSKDEYLYQKAKMDEDDKLLFLKNYIVDKCVRNGIYALLQFLPKEYIEVIKKAFVAYLDTNKITTIQVAHVTGFIHMQFKNEQQTLLLYFVEMSCRVQ